ncbi:MAG: hypothetical protein WAM42_03755 [Candidatus Nitrosopolaris sp.]
MTSRSVLSGLSVRLSTSFYLFKAFGPVNKAIPQQASTTLLLITQKTPYSQRYLLKKDSAFCQASSAANLSYVGIVSLKNACCTPLYNFISKVFLYLIILSTIAGRPELTQSSSPA